MRVFFLHAKFLQGRRLQVQNVCGQSQTYSKASHGTLYKLSQAGGSQHQPSVNLGLVWFGSDLTLTENHSKKKHVFNNI